MDFFRLFDFWQESHWILHLYLKKIRYKSFINIATIFSCCFLKEYHLVLLLAIIWRSNLSVLRKIWLSECLPFDNCFFVIINQKIGYPDICSNCIFSKTSVVLRKLQTTISTKMFCIWKIYLLLTGND